MFDDLSGKESLLITGFMAWRCCSFISCFIYMKQIDCPPHCTLRSKTGFKCAQCNIICMERLQFRLKNNLIILQGKEAEKKAWCDLSDVKSGIFLNALAKCVYESYIMTALTFITMIKEKNIFWPVWRFVWGKQNAFWHREAVF